MSPSDVLVVLCTCPPEAADGLARMVIQSRLAACVNILPGIKSVYRWEGEVEEAGESLLVMKTQRARFEALQEAVSDLHTHDVPELLALDVQGGLEAYLDWVLRESSPLVERREKDDADPEE